MKHWKKLLSLALTLALALSLAGCGKTDPQDTGAEDQTQTEEQTEEPVSESYSIAALKGPTAMGLVKLMSDTDEKAAQMLDSSEPYDADEYIRDYDAFVREVNGRA